MRFRRWTTARSVLVVVGVVLMLGACAAERGTAPPAGEAGEVVLSLVSDPSVQLDTQLQVACIHALTGKCFRGEEQPGIAPDMIGSYEDAAAYCSSTPVYCTVEECTNRIAVVLGITPGGSRGNPCLP